MKLFNFLNYRYLLKSPSELLPTIIATKLSNEQKKKLAAICIAFCCNATVKELEIVIDSIIDKKNRGYSKITVVPWQVVRRPLKNG